MGIGGLAHVVSGHRAWVAMALLVSACGGSTSQDVPIVTSTPSVSTTAAATSTTQVGEDGPASPTEDGPAPPTEDDPAPPTEDDPAPPREAERSAVVDPEAVHYVGGIDNRPLPGWSRITGLPAPTFFVDGVLPERFELGYHSLLVLDSCLTLPAEVDPKTVIEGAGLQVPADLEGPLCESFVRLESIFLATEAASTVTFAEDGAITIEVPRIGTVNSLYINDADGNNYSQSVEQIFEGFSLRVDVYPDRLEGSFIRPDGSIGAGVDGVRTGWAVPFTVERARQTAEWGATAPLEIPQIPSLAEPPPQGITVVWFECGLTSPTVNQFCVDETEEMRRATDALGWELQVVQSTTTYHGSEAAVPYREALQFDGDVYIPRGFSQGGWSQSDVNKLLAGGAVIIDNGFDGNIDRGPWSTIEPQRNIFPPPYVEAWMLADAGGPFTFGGDANALPVSNPRSFCGACIWVPISYGSALEQILADWPDIEYLRLGWEDEVADAVADYTVVNLPGHSAVWVEPGAGLGAPGQGNGLERPWYLIDLALRALASDEPINASYQLPEYRLFFEGEEPSLNDDFRNAFLEAWGVAG